MSDIRRTLAIPATGLTDGRLPLEREPVRLPVANVLAWTVISSLPALWDVRRSRART